MRCQCVCPAETTECSASCVTPKRIRKFSGRVDVSERCPILVTRESLKKAPAFACVVL